MSFLCESSESLIPEPLAIKASMITPAKNLATTREYVTRWGSLAKNSRASFRDRGRGGVFIPTVVYVGIYQLEHLS
jgi:hypothetical protein